MPQNSKLLAWIEPRSDDQFLAAFVGKPVAGLREPATQTCASQEEARLWVEQEAAAVGLPVEWVSQAPRQ
jgi:hypothetical protein